MNALRENLQVSHKAVESWIGALERLYAIFRIAPLGERLLSLIKDILELSKVEAMSSHRPYQPGLGIEAALKEIEDKRAGATRARWRRV